MKKESSRKIFEDDRWSPFPSHAAPGQPPPSIRGLIKPSSKAVAKARKIWAEQGYKGE